jgi:hypothetical protein
MTDTHVVSALKEKRIQVATRVSFWASEKLDKSGSGI